MSIHRSKKACAQSHLYSPESGSISTLPGLTSLAVESVAAHSQGGSALLALEAASVEELALSADPLQHVDAPPAEITHVTATRTSQRSQLQGQRITMEHGDKGWIIYAAKWWGSE